MTNTTVLASAAIYNPSSGRDWTAVATNMATARRFHTATLLRQQQQQLQQQGADRRRQLGRNDQRHQRAAVRHPNVDLVDDDRAPRRARGPHGDQARRTATCSSPAADRRRTPLRGRWCSRSRRRARAATWVSRGNMTSARRAHTATLLSTGILATSRQVLVAGGTTAGRRLRDGRALERATTWTATTSAAGDRPGAHGDAAGERPGVGRGRHQRHDHGQRGAGLRPFVRARLHVEQPVHDRLLRRRRLLRHRLPPAATRATWPASVGTCSPKHAAPACRRRQRLHADRHLPGRHLHRRQPGHLHGARTSATPPAPATRRRASCSNPTKADGTPCNDGNACTQTDTCQAGTCTGANPVTCAAPDQCHDAGTCNPATGVCSNPDQGRTARRATTATPARRPTPARPAPAPAPTR